MKEFRQYPQNIPLKWLDKRQGLDSGQVHNISQTSEGQLWFSGPNGLSRYNGSRIENLTRKFNLTTHGLRSVTVGKHDILYVATDMGIDRIKDGRCSPLYDPWPYGTVNSVVPLGDGIAFSSSSGLYRAEGTGISRILPGAFGLLHVDQASNLWAHGSDQMIYILDPALQQTEKNPPLLFEKLSCLTRGSANSVLLANDVCLLEVCADGSGRSMDVVAVSAAVVDNDELWLCSEDRLIRYQMQDNRWQNPVVIDPEVQLNHLFRDLQGNIWGASDSRGVLKISALRHMIHQPVFDSRGAVFYINRVDDHHYMIGGKSFNMELETKQPPCFREHFQIDAGRVWDYLRTDAAELFATNHGFYQRQDGQVSKLFDDQPSLKEQGRVLYKQGESVWLGSRFGLVQWIDGVARCAVTLDGNSLGYVYSISEDSAGRLWVGTIDNGLWVQAEQGFIKHPLRYVENQCSVYCITFNDQDDMLLLHDNLISVHSSKGVSQLIALTDTNVSGWCGVWDGSSVWVGGIDGLTEYDVDSKTQRRRITALLGSANWEFTTSKSLKLIDRRYLLCGLNSGLAIVDKTHLQQINKRPRPQIDGIKWINATMVESSSGLAVRPGKWTLTITYFSAWFHNEESNRFRYKLVGLEEDWHETAQCEAHYNSLPVGHYQFEIQASSPLTGWGEVVQLLAFEVVMPWWAKGWLSGLFNLFDTSIGFVTSRWRNKALIRENKQLEDSLQDRTSEIREAYREIQQVNQELIALANTDLLTGLANRRAFDQALRDEFERAVRYSGHLAVLMIDIDDFKQWNDRYGHDKGDEVLKRVALVLTQSVRSGDSVCRFGGEEFSIILPQTQNSGARTVASEVINNVSLIDISAISTDPLERLHVSVGIAVREHNDSSIRSSDALLKLSDEALYRAKANGKNQFAD